MMTAKKGGDDDHDNDQRRWRWKSTKGKKGKGKPTDTKRRKKRGWDLGKILRIIEDDGSAIKEAKEERLSSFYFFLFLFFS